MSPLQDKRLLLVVSGSIAAYKSLELVRLLLKAGAQVEAILTRGGEQFVAPLAMETLLGRKAHREMWDDRAYEMNHIRLSRWADLIVVATASADLVAKLANGLGDDLASTTLLARDKPILLAPSMNVEMWENPAFQRNLERALADGARCLPPQSDILACGEEGLGKMAEPQTIFESVEAHFRLGARLAGRRAVVTSGGTLERIDGVRYLGNFSSGKQGNAIALALAQAGADVALVLGNATAPVPAHPRLAVRRAESAAEMLERVSECLPADVFVGCAAVCDFRVANPSARKIKKEEGLDLQFEPNPDILQTVGQAKPDRRPRLVVGFAAETESLVENASRKLQAKGCDLVVANDVSDGKVFGREDTRVVLVSADGEEDLGPHSKTAAAEALVDRIAQRLQAAEA